MRRTAMSVTTLLLALASACGGGGEGERTGQQETGAATQQPSATTTTASASGEQLYQRCATCHQTTGQGLPGTYPPLVGSEYANAANPAVPISVVIHGLQGPITVHGQQYNSIMPAYGTGVPMSDDEVAAVLTYVRSSWGNTASAVTPQQVAEVRGRQRSASGPMTAQELDSLMRAQ